MTNGRAGTLSAPAAGGERFHGPPKAAICAPEPGTAGILPASGVAETRRRDAGAPGRFMGREKSRGCRITDGKGVDRCPAGGLCGGTWTGSAEQTGRKAYLVELDPIYCDVIVARYESFTAKKAERVAAEVAP